jgi:hypothetical protein
LSRNLQTSQFQVAKVTVGKRRHALGIDVLAKEMDAVLSSARCQATSENASITENSSDSVAGRAGGPVRAPCPGCDQQIEDGA